MRRLITFVLVGCMALFLTGCPEDGTSPPPPAPVVLDPQYLACISTVPVDAGNPNEPVTTLLGPRVVNQSLGSVYVDAGATASDPHDGDIHAA